MRAEANARLPAEHVQGETGATQLVRRVAVFGGLCMEEGGRFDAPGTPRGMHGPDSCPAGFGARRDLVPLASVLRFPSLPLLSSFLPLQAYMEALYYVKPLPPVKTPHVASEGFPSAATTIRPFEGTI